MNRLRVKQYVLMVKFRGLTGRFLAAVSLFAVSLTMAVLSLTTARGVVLIDPQMSSYETEFLNPFWATAAFALAVPIGVMAWRWPGSGLVSCVAALLPQVWLAIQFQVNAAVAGWTGPFDLLVFGWPILECILYGLTVGIVQISRQRP